MADNFVEIDDDDDGRKKTSVSRADEFTELGEDPADGGVAVSSGPILVYEALLGAAAAAYVLGLIMIIYRLKDYSDF